MEPVLKFNLLFPVDTIYIFLPLHGTLIQLEFNTELEGATVHYKKKNTEQL